MQNGLNNSVKATPNEPNSNVNMMRTALSNNASTMHTSASRILNLSPARMPTLWRNAHITEASGLRMAFMSMPGQVNKRCSFVSGGTKRADRLPVDHVNLAPNMPCWRKLVGNLHGKELEQPRIGTYFRITLNAGTVMRCRKTDARDAVGLFSNKYRHLPVIALNLGF